MMFRELYTRSGRFTEYSSLIGPTSIHFTAYLFFGKVRLLFFCLLMLRFQLEVRGNVMFTSRVA